MVKLTTEQREKILQYVGKMWKYLDKHQDMITEYKSERTKERAIQKYEAFSPVLASRYRKAWKGMPKMYENKMTNIEERIRNWLMSYIPKVFGVIPDKDDIDWFISKIKEYAAG
jgi:hypothetical protein